MVIQSLNNCLNIYAQNDTPCLKYPLPNTTYVQEEDYDHDIDTALYTDIYICKIYSLLEEFIWLHNLVETLVRFFSGKTLI